MRVRFGEYWLGWSSYVTRFGDFLLRLHLQRQIVWKIFMTNHFHTRKKHKALHILVATFHTNAANSLWGLPTRFKLNLYFFPLTKAHKIPYTGSNRVTATHKTQLITMLPCIRLVVYSLKCKAGHVTLLKGVWKTAAPAGWVTFMWRRVISGEGITWVALAPQVWRFILLFSREACTYTMPCSPRKSPTLDTNHHERRWLDTNTAWGSHQFTCDLLF